MEYKHYIKIANDLIITEKFTVQDFKQTKYYTGQDLSVFFWIDSGLLIDGIIFGVGLYFENDLVKCVFLHSRDNSISEENKLPIYDTFINKHPEYGDAEYEYDERGKESLIIIDM
jgi:hypothetical protein